MSSKSSIHATPPPLPFNYTDALTRLIADIVTRVKALQHIDPQRLLVFASAANSAQAHLMACYCLCLPQLTEEEKAAIQRMASRGVMRRDYSIYKMPTVTIHDQRKEYLLSFGLPRFCDLVLRSPLETVYPAGDVWGVKLACIMQTLAVIGPPETGFAGKRYSRDDCSRVWNCPTHDEKAASLVREYFASGPSEEVHGFLHYQFDDLLARHKQVVATVFKIIPHYPRGRWVRWLNDPRPSTQQWDYSEQDLITRPFPMDLQTYFQERKRSPHFQGQPPHTSPTAEEQIKRLNTQLQQEGEIWGEEIAWLESHMWDLIDLVDPRGPARKLRWLRRWIEDGDLNGRRTRKRRVRDRVRRVREHGEVPEELGVEAPVKPQPEAEPVYPEWTRLLATLSPRDIPAKRWLMWLLIRDMGPLRARDIEKHLIHLGRLTKARNNYQPIFALLRQLRDEGYLTMERKYGESWWSVTGKQPPRYYLRGLAAYGPPILSDEK